MIFFVSFKDNYIKYLNNNIWCFFIILCFYSILYFYSILVVKNEIKFEKIKLKIGVCWFLKLIIFYKFICIGDVK